MSRISWLASISLLIVLLFISCARPASPPAEVKTPAATTAPVSSAKATWEEKWEAAVAAAKKEGAVSLYTLWLPKIRNPLSAAFKEKYGIELEFTLFSRGDEIGARTSAEQRAGLYLADVFTPGNAAILLNMKPLGVLGPIEPLLVLPEVKDPKAWLGGRIPFVDKDTTAMSMLGAVQLMIVYNTNLVKDSEITSYKDLLKPQYKGKIVLNDPQVTGGSNAILTHISQNLWSEAETADFLKRLIKDQEAVVQRDHRLHVEWLARGKYAIGIAPLREAVAEFAGLGAPIKFARRLQEENHITPSTGTLAVPSKFAHPNAAMVFVNWLLTREGQSVFATSFGSPSMRRDASRQGIDPLLIPDPDQKYYFDTEEEMDVRARWLEIAKKTIAENMK